MAELVAMNRSLSDLVKTLQDEVAGLRASNQRLLRTNSASSSQARNSKVDVQRPTKYSGSRDARAIDNFLFQVDYYLDLQNVVEKDLKIKTAMMLLEGDAMAWWRWKMLDIKNGDCTIRTFDDFHKQLKGYFMPVNAERHAYRLVANLKQTGLQSWAQADVERSNPETLEQAYVAAERLADTQHRSYIDTFRSTKESDHDGKREERRDNRNESSPQKPVERKPFFRKDYNGPPREVTCWVCGGRHYMRVCSKRVRLTEQANAARVTEGWTEEGEGSRIGTLQLLNSVKREEKAKVTAMPSRELMYIEILVNGKPTMAMIDTGATHNFVSVVEAKRLGLTLERRELRMKAVNSEAKPIHGLARDVVVKIESWSEKR
ncbi:hypothetical protein EJ110_NYTH29203 [Nymphaea thermarum]|nr:hypothetical protein EJ110_NYTH29203 [Nymphaea thermarum]